MEDEKQVQQEKTEYETMDEIQPEKGNWRNLKLFLFSFTLFAFAYWLGATQSENHNLLGQIYEKGLECMGKVTQVSEPEKPVVSASILDLEDTDAALVPSNEPAQEQTQILQQEQEKTIPKFHVVAKGDTLRSISMYYYGDYGMIDAICKMNQIEDSNCIECGQTLFLP